MSEGEPAELDVVHPLPTLDVAEEGHELLQPRGDHDRLVGLFAGPREIREQAAGPVEIPLARLAERFADVFDEEAVSLEERPPAFRTVGPTGEGDDPPVR